MCVCFVFEIVLFKKIILHLRVFQNDFFFLLIQFGSQLPLKLRNQWERDEDLRAPIINPLCPFVDDGLFSNLFSKTAKRKKIVFAREIKI